MKQIPRKEWKKFVEWYPKILRKAGIYDDRYPAKGMGVWLPYGFKLREKVYGYLKKLHTEAGYEQVQFPTLIPEDIFRKEAEHVASFEKEVFWVTRGGLTELDKKFVLRPTSETPMYYMFSLWLNSYKDLPFRIFQIVNVFRYETKATHPLFREREISIFFESHSAFLTQEEAEEEVRRAVEIYKKFFDYLGIPYIITRRPDWDKFPGADYTIAFDTLMPNGRTLQIGTVHNLGQNFSKPFDIKVITEKGENKHVWQVCFGVSGRVITALVAVHGDDHGPVFPFHVAPIQVVIIPIPMKDGGISEKVLEKSRKVFELLKKAGISVVLDDKEDETPGSKYYKWELRGVPLRIEIGPREVKEGKITITRRDNLERITVSDSELIEKIKEIGEKMFEDMKQRAMKFFKENIVEVSSIDKANKMVEEGKIAILPWCGDEKESETLEEIISGRIIGILLNKNNLKPEKPREGLKCAICGKNAKKYLVIAKSY